MPLQLSCHTCGRGRVPTHVLAFFVTVTTHSGKKTAYRFTTLLSYTGHSMYRKGQPFGWSCSNHVFGAEWAAHEWRGPRDQPRWAPRWSAARTHLALGSSPAPQDDELPRHPVRHKPSEQRWRVLGRPATWTVSAAGRPTERPGPGATRAATPDEATWASKRLNDHLLEPNSVDARLSGHACVVRCVTGMTLHARRTQMFSGRFFLCGAQNRRT